MLRVNGPPTEGTVQLNRAEVSELTPTIELMFEDLEAKALESELVTLAGHLAAATCRMLQLLAEFDTREAWAGPGLRSCAHWMNWRVGMSLRTARDHIRVAHALTRLPATTAAFGAGRISYSKARALTRVATADNEDALLNVALHGTTSQLETLVRAARTAADPRPAAARRGLRCTRTADGSLLVRLRIPAEQGEEFLSLIDDHLAELADGSAEPPENTPDSAGGPDETAAAHADPATHHQRHSAERAEATDRAADHAPGPTLDPTAARRLDALLDLLRGAHPARRTTLLVHLRLDQPADDQTPGDQPADTPAADQASEVPRPTTWIEGGPAIPQATAERLTCTAAVQALLVDRSGNPLYLGRTRRLAGPAQLIALRVRDEHRCRFPGCTRTRGLEAHHIRWWRFGGPTDLDNLVLICGYHHTLVHEHGYRISREHERLVFERPDRTPIPDAGPPLAGRADDLLAQHARDSIDSWTITPRWGGERLDPHPILHWLVPELRAAHEKAAA